MYEICVVCEEGGVFGEIICLDYVEECFISGFGGDIMLCVLILDIVDGVYLYLYGGGWVFGLSDV